MRRLHTIDLNKQYVLLCSSEELERIADDSGLPENTPIFAAIATESGRIVDLESARKMIAKQSDESKAK